VRIIITFLKRNFPHYLPVLRGLRDIWKGPGLHLINQPHLSTDSGINGPRVNLVIPPVGGGGYFGGLLTGFGLAGHLMTPEAQLRVLVMGKCSSHEDLISDIRRNSDIPLFCKIEIVELGKGVCVLPVSRHDRFVCTTWRTANLVQNLAKSSSLALHLMHWPLVYLIQDYEPGFYPWSSEFVLARNTYEWNGSWIPVFNSESLSAYVNNEHRLPEKQYTLEPVYSKNLYSTLQGMGKKSWEKEKIIFLYGRPNTPRNGFDFAVDALRMWSSSYEDASKWKVISAGELHKDISLGNGCKIQSAGMLTINEYAELLLRSAVGLSLMISPHPSYPPLEMASCGVRVLTNVFDCKEWQQRHKNIGLISDWTPESVAEDLARLCRKEEAGIRYGQFINTIMAPPDKAYAFVGELRKDLGLS